MNTPPFCFPASCRFAPLSEKRRKSRSGAYSRPAFPKPFFLRLYIIGRSAYRFPFRHYKSVASVFPSVYNARFVRIGVGKHIKVMSEKIHLENSRVAAPPQGDNTSKGVVARGR